MSSTRIPWRALFVACWKLATSQLDAIQQGCSRKVQATPVDEGADAAPELDGPLHPAGRTRQPQAPQSCPQHALIALACTGKRCVQPGGMCSGQRRRHSALAYATNKESTAITITPCTQDGRPPSAPGGRLRAAISSIGVPSTVATKFSSRKGCRASRPRSATSLQHGCWDWLRVARNPHRNPALKLCGANVTSTHGHRGDGSFNRGAAPPVV